MFCLLFNFVSSSFTSFSLNTVTNVKYIQHFEHNPEEKIYVRPGTERRTKMQLVLMKKYDVGMWTGFTWLRRDLVVGSCEQGNEPLGSI
jgi:hypothetical protein